VKNTHILDSLGLLYLLLCILRITLFENRKACWNLTKERLRKGKKNYVSKEFGACMYLMGQNVLHSLILHCNGFQVF